MLFRSITGEVTIATTDGQHDITYNLKDWQIGLIPDDVDTLASQSRKPYVERKRIGIHVLPQKN